jgi:CRISPR type III-B/RAMP module RAMP protein Cmr1
MNTQTYPLELITPGFCGGAWPETQAEIRAPSIRGQLRWWFRALGGFQSLAPMSMSDQENRIFGQAKGNMAVASRLIVRVHNSDPNQLRSRISKDADGLHAPVGSERGYLLFPLRNQRRAVFEAGQLPRFELIILWHGDAKLWEDIQALVTVFGHWGSLGFRSRRAMGALAFQSRPPVLTLALKRFVAPQQVIVKTLPARDANHAIIVLAQWLRRWRSYGRTAGPQLNPFKPGFVLAKKDHDAGLNQHPDPAFRPALGLPIIQSYTHTRRTVRWDESWDPQRRRGEGRFASPVLLRPYRAAPQRWLALVIFVESHRWPAGNKVFLDGQPRTVSLDLYEAMKNDPAFGNFSAEF